MKNRFTGAPEHKMVKCDHCNESMEYLTDGENIDGKNFCWDCWDADYPEPLELEFEDLKQIRGEL